MKLNEIESKVLGALVGAYDTYAGGGFCSFNFLSSETGFDRKQVRRACRSLKRKGLSEFGKGLWNDDGEPAGSGYSATRQGCIALKPDNRE